MLCACHYFVRPQHAVHHMIFVSTGPLPSLPVGVIGGRNDLDPFSNITMPGSRLPAPGTHNGTYTSRMDEHSHICCGFEVLLT